MAARTFYRHLAIKYLPISLLVLIFCQNNPIEVAADKVTQHDADIHTEYLEGMCLQEGYRYSAIVKGVGHAVGEASYDEERNCKQEREHVAFAGKCHRSGHEQTAWDAEEAASEGSGLESELENLLRSCLDVHRRDA